MNRIEISNNWSLSDIKESTNKIFVYDDSGQFFTQSILKELPNTIGLLTKKHTLNNISFFCDDEYEKNCEILTNYLLSIRNFWSVGKTIVFSKDGYGNGLSNLQYTAPKTYQFLVDVMRDFFEYDNITGKFWKKTPSIDDVNEAKYVDFLKSNDKLLIPVNNSYFREEFLISSLNSNYDLIKNEHKLSFFSKDLFKKDEYLMIKFEKEKNYLFVKVCLDSYKNTTSDSEILSNFEGYIPSFFNDKNISEFFQTQIKYICEISDKGEIIFKKDLFTSEVPKNNNGESVGFPIFKERKNTDECVNYKRKTIKLFRNPFRKSFDQLLEEKNLKGEITKIDNGLLQNKRDSYQVKVDTNYYYIVFHKHLFTNSIEILIASKQPFL